MPKNIVSEDVYISKKYDAVQRRAIANDIIDHIRKRTKKGQGKGGQSWKGKAALYSKSYKSSLDFKLKASKSPVNLTLTGDMLTAIQVISNQKGKLQIGIPFGEQEWSRAKGNILGSYGGKPNSSKARPFLELSKKEIEKITSKYPTAKKEKEKNIDKLKKLEKTLGAFGDL